MKFTLSENLLRVLCCVSIFGSHLQSTVAFSVTSPTSTVPTSTVLPTTSTSSALGVSIGLGPESAVDEEEDNGPPVAGVDYEVPDHEAYRTSRRSKLDEQCDRWFGALLGDETQSGVLGPLADGARETLLTPVPLVNEVSIPCSVSEFF